MYANPEGHLNHLKTNRSALDCPWWCEPSENQLTLKLAQRTECLGVDVRINSFSKMVPIFLKTSCKMKCLKVVVHCIFLVVLHPFSVFFMALLLCVSTGTRPRTGCVLCRAPVKCEDAVQKLVRILIWKWQSMQTSHTVPLEPALVGSLYFLGKN